MSRLSLFVALLALVPQSSAHVAQAAVAAPSGGIFPPGTLSHFCVITSWEGYNETVGKYATLLGIVPPVPGIAGGVVSNGTYVVDGVPQVLTGTTLIAFVELNNSTRMEFLAGNMSAPSWWRDVYLSKGLEIHHQGHNLPSGYAIWPVVEAFESAGLGSAVQWGRWGTIDTPGSGCYVYMDSQLTLGVTVEILASESDCDDLPAPPAPS